MTVAGPPRVSLHQEKIALTGVACRFPGAPDLAAFWRLLTEGREAIRRYSNETLIARGVPRATFCDPNFVPAGGELDDADLFDAGFFGYSAREAALMDPQQRLMLECAWHAFEDACLVPGETGGITAVFASIGPNSYLPLNLARAPAAVQNAGQDMVRIANRLDNAATRIAYKLGLNGPALTVQTGCSSSLVGVHLAISSLLAGHCDTALVIGCRYSVGRGLGYRFVEHGVVSPDGHCRAFDSRAQGMVGGDGVAAVVLRRHQDAVVEGDPVRALILGSAVNNDGAAKLGYTAPSVSGQVGVIVEALAVSGIGADSITCVEAHGTGTELGDQVEIAALSRAFRVSAPALGGCALGSVKTNIGHLDVAAGLAGLIKMMLQLEHQTLVPSLHFETANSALELEKSPFRVVTATRPWQANGLRRGGVSSFGIGGTNAHLVVEEAPSRPLRPAAPGPALLVVSAESDTALAEGVAQLSIELRRTPEAALAGIARTSRIGRAALPFRRFVVADTPARAADGLERARPVIPLGPQGAPELWFVCPGQGDVAAGLAGALYRRQPLFRRSFDRLAEVAAECDGPDLLALLDSSAPDLQDTVTTQPLLFALGVSLHEMWAGFALTPAAVLGHSLGELTAAAIAGLLPQDEMMRFIIRRARIMSSAPPGAMAAVALPEAELCACLPEGLSLAAVNGPRLCVVSGEVAAVDSFLGRLAREGHAARRLPVRCAFHSALLDPILPELRAAFADFVLRPPRLPIWSPLSGGWLSAVEACNPDYWVRQVRLPIRWWSALQAIAGPEPKLFLELGPADTLTRTIRQIGVGIEAVASASGMPETVPLEALGQLWQRGLAPDWAALDGGDLSRIHRIPAYAFERTRHWIDPETDAPGRTDPLEPKAAPRDWLWTPSWRRANPLLGSLDRARQATPGWLLVGADPVLAAELPQPCEAVAATVEQRAAPDWWRVRLRAGTNAVLFWPTGDAGPDRLEPLVFELHAVALAAEALKSGSVQLVVVTRGAADLSGEVPADTAQQAALAMLTVMQQEIPGLTCRAVDLPPRGEVPPRALSRELALGNEPRVALRGSARWASTVHPLDPGGGISQIKLGGHYLITGAFGRIGQRLSAHLRDRWAARLALAGRGTPRGTQPRDLIRCFDVTDTAALAEAIAATEARSGPLDGVFHIAGTTGSYRSLAELDLAHLRSHTAPKVLGLDALHRALGDRPLDFVALFSSLSTAVGGYGYGAQTVANAWLDAFAEARHAKGDRRWRSIAWEGWQFGTPPRIGLAGAEAARLALTPEDGIAALELALVANGPARLLVSTADLTARIDRYAAPARAPEPTFEAAKGTEAFSATESALAGLWSRLLGPAVNGRDADFFALGGHSLMAAQLCAQLREHFDINLPLSAVFENPTLGDLAEAIETAVLTSVESMSDDEADAELATETGNGRL